jgi:hypothetical protein
MSTPPNTGNLTIPGGIILNFQETGGTMRDLGYLRNMDLEPRTEELKYHTNRSGKRRVAKVFTIEEEVTMRFNLNEPVVNNLLPYFKGGTVETVGGGTDTETDQKLTLTGQQLAGVGKYGISSVTVRQFLDSCLKYDGSAYTDHTTEADSLAGTPFNLLEDSGDYVYFGKSTKFQEIYIDLDTVGSYTTVEWEYWNGSTWTSLTVAGAGKDLDADGKVNWTVPTTWATTTVNSVGPYYWVRVKCASVTTVATCNCVRQNAVQNTDYIVDPGLVSGTSLKQGAIGRLSAGFLADGEQVKVSYTYTTWTSLTFPLATDNFKEGSARLDFLTAQGLRGRYHIHKCQLKPGGAVTLNDQEVMDVPMVLEVLDDYTNNPTEPYGYWEALDES